MIFSQLGKLPEETMNWQKQSFIDVPRNRCPKKFHKFHRKALVLEPLFNKVAGFQTYNFIKKRLQHRCFPMKFAKFLRKFFYRTPPVATSVYISSEVYSEPKAVNYFHKKLHRQCCQGSEFTSVAILKYFRKLQGNTNYITLQK